MNRVDTIFAEGCFVSAGSQKEGGIHKNVTLGRLRITCSIASFSRSVLSGAYAGNVHAGPSENRALWVRARVLIVGGNWNNGANAGLSAWNSNNDLSNSNSNIGARLAYPSDRKEIINITLGKDLAAWQKITEEQTRHPAGRRASGYARPNVGTEDDRGGQGVCL